MLSDEITSTITVPFGTDFVTEAIDPATTFIDRDEAESQLTDLRSKLFDLHELMMANEQHAVLLVLQGLDCSGKNGTIKHVVSAVNPAGLHIASFTEPEGKEEDEHFLERIRRNAPKPGQLVVFDRSHYEDVFVPAVHDGMNGDEFDSRLDEIDEFERSLVDDGVDVIKCFLHISYDEQRERFLRRIRREDKRWKFSENDLTSRRRWPEWQVVYGKAIGRTSCEHAPWYAIPADHKWHRNWLIASLLVDHFERLGEQYPPLATDTPIDDLRAQLAPPN
jgi:PPK2 family polyphosphate:nucleotide phosphotransferase